MADKIPPARSAFINYARIRHCACRINGGSRRNAVAIKNIHDAEEADAWAILAQRIDCDVGRRAASPSAGNGGWYERSFRRIQIVVLYVYDQADCN